MLAYKVKNFAALLQTSVTSMSWMLFTFFFTLTELIFESAKSKTEAPFFAWLEFFKPRNKVWGCTCAHYFSTKDLSEPEVLSTEIENQVWL